MISVDSLFARIKEERPEFAQKFSDEELRAYVAAHVDELAAMKEIHWDNETRPATRREQLENFRDLGAYGVRVTSMRQEGTCSACSDHDTTVYRLEEALEEEPLPYSECENQECRCYYGPLFDKETFEKWKEI